MRLDPAQHIAVDDLIGDSAMLIDAGKFEEWVAFFEPEGRYIVIPRENREQGYDVALISCLSRNILADRITVLHRASKFNPHYDRHILSRTRIVGVEGKVVTAHTNFMIAQTTLEGTSKLFCAGCYEDKIAIGNGAAQFRERVAIIDTFSVPNLIATPI